MRVTVLSLLLLLVSAGAFAQWQVVRVPKVPAPQPHTALKLARNVSARTLDTIYRTPLQLPFWDDFSVQKNGPYPDSTHWLFSRSVIWNYGMGIRPPSIGVVTFNGLDSLGSPYDLTTPLRKAYGDKLISWPIDLSNIPAAQLDSVYVSFFYQYQGNGEPPDMGDHLLVEFKTDTGSWNADTTINVMDSEDPTIFKVMNLKIKNSHYFHDQFQFRIRSFGRVSGPWDTWNVDYVYVNTHRYATDVTAPYFKDSTFPDRTIVTPPGSIFGDYWSIPATHFYQSSDTSLLQEPSFVVSNRRQTQLIDSAQNISYTPTYTIDQWNGGAKTTNTVTFGPSPSLEINDLYYDENRTVPITAIPSRTDFNAPSADSVKVSFKLYITSDDNKIGDPTKVDYSPKFIPIDFRVNDTVRTVQVLRDYYAYDDGTAEFAAGLNQPGTEMAYRFDMKSDTIDNLMGVYLYFPNTGDQSNQTIILTVRSDTTLAGMVYGDTMTIQRSAFDKFIYHEFYRSVRVKNHFYVGWVQTSSVLVGVGLDASHDTAEKIFFNVGSKWEYHPNVFGSLMIRPRFGGVISGVEEDAIPLDVYPNPSTGTFYLSRDPESYDVIDFTGRRIPSTKESAGDGVKITLQNPIAGLYLLKARLANKTITKRVIVQESLR